ncbi:lycopene cyclase family protein [Dyadobacter crusticola]|uniref:lycopene cyclase family protein n=1 Tax=Dyadobacter crusticola TaxID=292407 RepID=UPI00068C9DA4|nr:lycopene cyclase family protein [Dyadobacter crusticola]
MEVEQFDIIITGSGLAGLSLAYRAIKEGIWQNEKILIIDKEPKVKNDRTWCFWQNEEVASPFQDVIYRSWKQLSFFSNEGRQIRLENGRYTYNMIRSIDFYQHVLSFLSGCRQVTFVYGEIKSIQNIANGGRVDTGQASYQGKYIFNSVYTKPELSKSDQYFLQHFKGVTIRTEQLKSSSTEMYLMDYRTSQENGTTFFYVLPISEQDVFVEYTIFSKTLLQQADYDKKIADYLTAVLGITDYQILESEFGVIPMTDFQFRRRSANIMHIGTIGGDTRASSGYTFTNTQKTISKILASYRKHGHPFSITENINYKHQLLDATILNVLDNNKYQGHQIFTDLFTNVKAKTIFSFLDSESTIAEDLQIMGSLKARHFIQPFCYAFLKSFK